MRVADTIRDLHILSATIRGYLFYFRQLRNPSLWLTLTFIEAKNNALAYNEAMATENALWTLSYLIVAL